MSQPIKQGDALYYLAVVLLLAVVGLTAWNAHAAARAARAAGEQLDDCLRMARRIQALREAPDRAEEQSRGHEELTQQIERWSRAASIQSQQILSVAPLAPRRVADSDYQELGAEVELAGVTLTQLAELADQIAAGAERLEVSDLRLQAPRDRETDGEPNEAWNAEIALTYLLYSPKSSSR